MAFHNREHLIIKNTFTNLSSLEQLLTANSDNLKVNLLQPRVVSIAEIHIWKAGTSWKTRFYQIGQLV